MTAADSETQVQTAACDRACVKTRVQLSFVRFQGSSDHYPTRKNRIQSVLRGRVFSMPIFFAFSHSLDPYSRAQDRASTQMPNFASNRRSELPTDRVRNRWSCGSGQRW